MDRRWDHGRPGTARLAAGGAILAAIAALVAGPARAETPAFPATLDSPAIRAWLQQETDIAADQVVAVSPSAVTAIVARRAGGGGPAQARLRAVALTAEAARRSGVLAWEMTLEADCRDAKVRTGATIGYAMRRPAGDGVVLAPAETTWRIPPRATSLESAWRALCEPSFQPPLRAPPPVLAQARAAESAAAPATAQVSIGPTPPVGSRAAPARRARSSDAAVQVVSSPDPAETARFLSRLRIEAAEPMASLDTRVQRAEVNGRIVYRGLVVGFASRAEAAAFCGTLKAQGHACLSR